MPDAIAASYDQCQRIARRAKSNFYFTFYLLNREKRRAMCALYAFLRRVDDLADEPLVIGIANSATGGATGGAASGTPDAQPRRLKLQQLRLQLDDAFSGRADDATLPALADTVKRFEIPREYLHAAIDGAERDLTGARFETFADLRQYCYQVASVVGLSCIHIWGFRDPAALEPAQAAGIAFQLTNILRDLKQDVDNHRVYLPQEDLRRFDYSERDLANAVYDSRFVRLIDFQIQRASEFYAAGQQLNRFLHADGRRIFSAMNAVYHRLLQEIVWHRGDVFTHRVRLNRWQKALLAAQSLVRPARPLKPLIFRTAAR